MAHQAKIFVFAPVDEYIEYVENYPSVTHVPLNNLSRSGLALVENIKLILELGRVLKKHPVDLFISYTHKPNIYTAIAKPKSLKSIAVVTGLGYPFIHNGLLRTITMGLYKIAAKRHNKIVFENKDDADFFIDKNIVHSNEAIKMKGCGVDLKHFQPSKDTLADHGKCIFTFIGRILYDKGIVEFIDAAKQILNQHSHVEFWVLGEFDKDNPASVSEKEIVEWVNTKRIKYLGFKKDVRKIIGKSSCIVLPSYREGMPRTIMEGMAMGKPIITTDVPGCRETVDHLVNGYLVEARNAGALANAMTTFMHLSDQQKIEMGQAGRKKATQEFDDKVIAEDIIAEIFALL